MTANQTKFITALVDGSFEQGRGFLKLESYDGKIKHCCLGVATECYVSDKGGSLKAQPSPKGGHSGAVFASIDGGASAFSILPAVVRDWLGLNVPQEESYISLDPYLEIPRDQIVDGAKLSVLFRRKASDWNDDGGATFSEIAAGFIRLFEQRNTERAEAEAIAEVMEKVAA